MRIQLTQVYSQKSTSTTLPRSASAVSGAEFTQRSALKAGSLLAAPARPSTGDDAEEEERQDDSHEIPDVYHVDTRG